VVSFNPTKFVNWWYYNTTQHGVASEKKTRKNTDRLFPSFSLVLEEK